MSLENIIDRRKRPYRWAKVNAVVEPTCHDNRVKDADNSPQRLCPKDIMGYEEMEHVSLGAAVEWAQGFTYPATLYLYDKDDGIYARHEHKRKRQAKAPTKPLLKVRKTRPKVRRP